MNFESLESWYTHAPGKFVLQAESRALEKILPELLGFYLLQLGGSSSFNLLKATRIPHCVHLGGQRLRNFPGANVIGEYTELPFARNSIDVVLLPHVLEFADEPKIILQQTHDVLAPEGHVVILGLQPFSLWGFHRHLADTVISPKRAQFLSSFRIRRWLTELDFTIVNYRTLFFLPPLENTKWLRKLFFIELIGQLLWPYLGSVYVIVAKKREVGLMPIKCKPIKRRIPVAAGAVQPTRRVTHETE